MKRLWCKAFHRSWSWAGGMALRCKKCGRIAIMPLGVR